VLVVDERLDTGIGKKGGGTVLALSRGVSVNRRRARGIVLHVLISSTI
jgi:hypothetical protein